MKLPTLITTSELAATTDSVIGEQATMELVAQLAQQWPNGFSWTPNPDSTISDSDLEQLRTFARHALPGCCRACDEVVAGDDLPTHLANWLLGPEKRQQQ